MTILWDLLKLDKKVFSNSFKCQPMIKRCHGLWIKEKVNFQSFSPLFKYLIAAKNYPGLLGKDSKLSSNPSPKWIFISNSLGIHFHWSWLVEMTHDNIFTDVMCQVCNGPGGHCPTDLSKVQLIDESGINART